MAYHSYKCDNCGKTTSEISKEPLDLWCDTCKIKLSRIWGAPKLSFKGEGWYVNDSKLSLAEQGKPIPYGADLDAGDEQDARR